MENNEIYIDGVDVAGCEFFDYECSAYRQEYWESEDNTKDMCSSHPDCYYKQLKRLEQVNEKLKKEVKQIGSDFIKKGDYARELEQENNDLKKQIESDKGLITVGGKQQYQYLQRIDELEQENKKLKETKGRCAFKCLDNTFCDEARIKIDKLELDKDCLNASLETARKYRGIAEVERDKYRSALEEIREILNKDCDYLGNVVNAREFIDKVLTP